MLLLALLAVLAVPLIALLLVASVYPIALGLGMAGLDSGAALARATLEALGTAFGPGALPTWVPRVVLVLSMAGLLVLVVGLMAERWRLPTRRRSAAHALWSLLGAPVDASGAISAGVTALWGILRGGAALRPRCARSQPALRRPADSRTSATRASASCCWWCTTSTRAATWSSAC